MTDSGAGAPQQTGTYDTVAETASIVVSLVSRQEVDVEDLPGLITRIHSALLDVGRIPASIAARETQSASHQLTQAPAAPSQPPEVAARAVMGRPEAQSLGGQQAQSRPVPAPHPEATSVPALPVEESITADTIYSLEDGKPYKDLARHLAARGMTPDEYRRKWELPEEYPMMPPNQVRKKGQLARIDPVTLKPM